jgi:hypothetical protein
MELTNASEIAVLHKEIASLERQAREFETWLLDNSEDAGWYKIKDKYDDVLFRIDFKRTRINSLDKGITLPRTYSMPPSKR